MSSPAVSDVTRRFFTLAGKLAMLDEQTADALADETHTRNVSAPQLVLQKGVLNPVQVEILQTLLNPHEIVPGYEILDVIGHGGMGVVYRARQKNLQRLVALKTVLMSQMGQEGAMAARFEQEAVVVARLRHPHVIAAFDFGRHEGRLYMALELVEGEDVEKAVAKHGPFSQAEALSIARQAAAGLAHAAEEGIVHRDIKPSNLLLVKPPAGYPLPVGTRMVKIADFGLAFLAQEDERKTRLTSANTTLGSPHYMAPEQLSGAAADLRADIYSLGATLYHMLAGRPPFAGQSLTQIVTNKLAGNVDDLVKHRFGLLPDTVRLVQKMMAREPQDRIGSYAELMEQLGACLARVELTGDVGGAPAVMTTAPFAVSFVARATPPPSSLKTVGDVASPQATPAKTPASIGRRKWLLLALGGSLALSLAIALVPFPGRLAGPGPRDLFPSDRKAWLFDGQEVRSGNIAAGQWTIAEDEEAGRVLAGANGTYRLPFFTIGHGNDQRPLRHYRLTLTVQLHQAASAEVHFGIPSGNGGWPRYVLLIRRDGVHLGEKAEEGQPLAIVSRIPLNVAGRIHAMYIDRQSQDFFVKVDDQYVGWVRGRDDELPEARLEVKDGPAHFSEILLEELVSKQ